MSNIERYAEIMNDLNNDMKLPERVDQIYELLAQTHKQLDFDLRKLLRGGGTGGLFVKPKKVTTTDSVSINYNEANYYVITALDTDVTINEPTGNFQEGDRLILRFQDDSTSRGITWDDFFMGELPNLTIPDYISFVEFIYDSDEGKFIKYYASEFYYVELVSEELDDSNETYLLEGEFFEAAGSALSSETAANVFSFEAGLRRNGSPSGSAICRIYEADGTNFVDNVLATSTNTVPVGEISTSGGFYEFKFDSFFMLENKNYFFMIEHPERGSSTDDCIYVLRSGFQVENNFYIKTAGYESAIMTHRLKVGVRK